MTNSRAQKTKGSGKSRKPLKAWCQIEARSKTGRKEKVKIDREDLDRVSALKWRVTTGTTGRKRVVTSIRGPNGSRQVTLGKFLMKPPRNKQVYPRRFNDELDYRKENLIVCSIKERQRLLPKKKSATSSKFRGVSYSETEKRWRAGIEVSGKAINLGNYEREADAALAYNEAAREYFGELAYQNPIDRKTQVGRRKRV